MTINKYTEQETTNFLAQLHIDGKVMESKYIEDSNIRKYLKATSKEFKRLQDSFSDYLEQLDPSITESFIEQWESSLGIPDECIPIATSDDERRDNIVLKLASLSAQTSEDIQRIAGDFGFTISFLTGDFPPYDVPFTIPAPTLAASYVWVIEGNFSIDPDKAAIFQCIVRSLVPVGYKVLFVEA